jgi:alpha-glucosidase
MKTLYQWSSLTQLDNGVLIEVEHNHQLCIYVLESNMFRVLLKKNAQLENNRTWTIAVDGQTPWEGRGRNSNAGFAQPAFSVTALDEHQTMVATDSTRVIIHQPLWLEWQRKNQDQQWETFAADRKTGAYQINSDGDGIAHYVQRDPIDKYYGLGDKTGDLNKAHRRFELRNLDAMGYNPQTTDPLYKHIPFYITKTETISYAMYYDNLSSSWFDLGNELDNYHAAYRKYQAEAGDLDFYLYWNDRILDSVKTFVRLTGKTIFPPKWSLGYSGSTMSYTDAPDAQVQLSKFIHLSQQHAIPCDSFQLSSGYTSIGSKRYVFHWNREKIPHPEQLTAEFHQAGLKLAANIKPCLLQDHPLYDEVKNSGLFISDSEQDMPERSVFWDDIGSHLDFTNMQTVRWWKQQVTQQLLQVGIDSTWNDNNEYEIWDGNARCHGFGQPIAIKHIRPVMPLLMMRASLEAQQEFAPMKRPYLISRSGCPGMQRYVQTWSGDNRTSWATLRYNIRTGLSMSLSGLYNVGHDVGGFSGDRPDPELFVRWVQNGIMHPRFTIHSWNDDHTVNEPWMYPQVLPAIRAAIELRYRLLPYFYTLLWLAAAHDEPILRPTFLDHETDASTFAETDDFMLGRDLLVASVVEPGQCLRDVYLPENQSGWYDYYTGDWFCGGQTIRVPAPLEKLPLFVRAGAMIPTGASIAHIDPKTDTVRNFMLYPPQSQGSDAGFMFDDDGESYAYQNNMGLWLRWQIRCTATTIIIDFTRQGDFIPAWQELTLVLPAQEHRVLVINQQLRNSIKFAELDR